MKWKHWRASSSNLYSDIKHREVVPGQSHILYVCLPLCMHTWTHTVFSISRRWYSRCMFLFSPSCLCMREGGKEGERENSLTRWHFTAPLFVSWTSSIGWVIAHSDLCLLSSPLITFTRCYCQSSDRQPTKMPPSEPSIFPIHYPYTSPRNIGHFPKLFLFLQHLNQ